MWDGASGRIPSLPERRPAAGVTSSSVRPASGVALTTALSFVAAAAGVAADDVLVAPDSRRPSAIADGLAGSSLCALGSYFLRRRLHTTSVPTMTTKTMTPTAMPIVMFGSCLEPVLTARNKNDT